MYSLPTKLVKFGLDLSEIASVSIYVPQKNSIYTKRNQFLENKPPGHVVSNVDQQRFS